MSLLCLANSDTHNQISIIFGTNVTENVDRQKVGLLYQGIRDYALYKSTIDIDIDIYFPTSPKCFSASALPAETENPEIASSHLNAACCLVFTKNTRTYFTISPGHS